MGRLFSASSSGWKVAVFGAAILSFGLERAALAFGSSPLDFSLEALISTQLAQQGALAVGFGWGPADSVSYNYMVNFDSGDFAFETKPGQVLGGQSLVMLTSGTFDAIDSLWSVSAAGLYGSTPFSMEASIMFEPDIGSVVSFEDPPTGFPDPGTVLQMTLIISGVNDPIVPVVIKRYVQLGSGEILSFGTALITAGSAGTCREGPVVNLVGLEPPGWQARYLGGGGGGGGGMSRTSALNCPLPSVGFVQSGAGTFSGSVLEGEFTQSVIPEPLTWAYMLAGFGILGLQLRRERGQAAIS